MSVRLEQVSVTYTDGRPALSDINLSIERQEQVALIGPSGSGKSSLLRVMSMALAPSTGLLWALYCFWCHPSQAPSSILRH